MEIVRLGGTYRQKGRGKTTVVLFQEAPKPRQFCRGNTFRKKPHLSASACTQGCACSPLCRDCLGCVLLEAQSHHHLPMLKSNLLRLGNHHQRPSVRDRTLEPPQNTSDNKSQLLLPSYSSGFASCIGKCCTW